MACSHLVGGCPRASHTVLLNGVIFLLLQTVSAPSVIWQDFNSDSSALCSCSPPASVENHGQVFGWARHGPNDGLKAQVNVSKKGHLADTGLSISPRALHGRALRGVQGNRSVSP